MSRSQPEAARRPGRADARPAARQRARKDGLLIRNASETLTLSADLGEGPLGRIARGAVAIVDGLVAWVGPERALPRAHRKLRTLDARGGAVTPGLVDAHTHAVFAGSRVAEFAMRAAGASYQAIHAAGGGIFSTVQATRAASDASLLAAARARLARAVRHGVVAAEAKSGYELSQGGELRSLGLIRRLGREPGLPRLSATLLCAHALPPEFAKDRQGYVRLCCERLIPEAARKRLASTVDAFVEDGAFTVEEADLIARAALAAGLGVRLHAEQFSRTGAADLAARHHAWSADHLEHVDDVGIRALAAAGTVATLLPGAAVQLRLAMPPARALLDAGVRVALGTDCNPGSSYSENLPLQMWLACTAMKMTVDEAWRAVTVNAARAAFGPGLDAPRATLDIDERGDVVIWQTPDHRDVPYHYGADLVSEVIIGGSIVR